MSEDELSKVVADELAKVGVTHPPLVTKAKKKFEVLAAGKSAGEVGAVISEWAKTEDIKHYILAPVNSGGGATGGASYGYTQRDKQDAVDWDLWAYIPQCEYWKAVALSLDIEPPEYSHEVKGWPDDYARRLKIAEAHIESNSLARSKASMNKVDLKVFGQWAQSLGWSLPDRFPRALAKESEKVAEGGEVTNLKDSGSNKQWHVVNPNDPSPEQSWYTPARYFARELVKSDSTLLSKREILSSKVSNSLFNAGIYGRTKNKKLDPGTVRKAFTNIKLG